MSATGAGMAQQLAVEARQVGVADVAPPAPGVVDAEHHRPTGRVIALDQQGTIVLIDQQCLGRGSQFAQGRGPEQVGQPVPRHLAGIEQLERFGGRTARGPPGAVVEEALGDRLGTGQAGRQQFAQAQLGEAGAGSGFAEQPDQAGGIAAHRDIDGVELLGGELVAGHVAEQDHIVVADLRRAERQMIVGALLGPTPPAFALGQIGMQFDGVIAAQRFAQIAQLVARPAVEDQDLEFAFGHGDAQFARVFQGTLFDLDPQQCLALLGESRFETGFERLRFLGTGCGSGVHRTFDHQRTVDQQAYRHWTGGELATAEAYQHRLDLAQGCARIDHHTRQPERGIDRGGSAGQRVHWQVTAAQPLRRHVQARAFRHPTIADQHHQIVAGGVDQPQQFFAEWAAGTGG